MSISDQKLIFLLEKPLWTLSHKEAVHRVKWHLKHHNEYFGPTCNEKELAGSNKPSLLEILFQVERAIRNGTSNNKDSEGNLFQGLPAPDPTGAAERVKQLLSFET